MQLNNPSHVDKWDQFVLSSDNYSIFHSSMWQRVLSDTYHYTPVYLSIIKNDKFQFLLPLIEISSYLTGKRGVSLPFTDYCDPILEPDFCFSDVTDQLLEFGKKSKWKYVELRSGRLSIPEKYISTYFYNHRLNLSKNTEKLFSSFSSNTQRNIKKAAREGVTVSISKSMKSLKHYYKLHCLTRKRHGIPPQSFNFFRKIYENIISKDFGFTILANHEDRIIAGAVYFHFGDQALYKFGASDMNYKKYRSNNLVMWEAIKWYAENNYKNFDFGRTVRRFKSGWGAKESIINYYKYDLVHDCYVKDAGIVPKQVQSFFKGMPVFVSKMAGNLIYKHVG